MRLICIIAAVFAWTLAADAHLCDNVFRQADKLIVKPETYNLVVKDQTTFKVFLQNNMDRGIAEIALQAESKDFDFEIKPKIMSVPQNQRAYFQVTMKAKPATGTGNYPVSFRLVGGGRVFKTFNMQASGTPLDAKTPPKQPGPASTTNLSRVSTSAVPPALPAILNVRSVSEAPVIDGSLNEPAWKTAAVLSNFSSSKGGRAVYDTVGLVSFDRKNLYFSFLCRDENLNALTENDFLELRLAFNLSGLPCYVMRISPTGKVAMKKLLAGGQETDWTASNIRFALEREGKAWTAEVGIPFAALDILPPVSVQKVLLRITRCKSSGSAEQSYWSAGPGGYNSEKGFGEILLGP